MPPSKFNADLKAEQDIRLAHIRHELRTPINAIIGYAQMMREDCEDVGLMEIAPDLDRIEASGRRLLELVNILAGQDTSQKMASDPQAFESELRVALRTPLSDVLGYSEMLLEDVSDATYKSDLAKIQKAGRTLFDTLDRLVSMASGTEQSDLKLTTIVDANIDGAVESLHAIDTQKTQDLKGRIVLADDSESNRDLLGRMLRKAGHEVIEAVDGQEALDIVGKGQADVLLLDIVMPRLNGYETLQRLKQDPLLRHLPVIVISALDHMDSVIKCVELGADDYLPKPCHQTLLNARLKSCLQRKRFRDQERLYLKRIEKEQERSDQLLHAIFPARIVHELKETQTIKSRRRDNVAVLFSDIVGFTTYCEDREPEEVIDLLQKVVVAYEVSAMRHGLQKIKTIGDAFMAAAGLLNEMENPVLASLRCGQEMIEATRALGVGWDVRIGIDLGPLMAGVLGERQYLFDVFGDTVNTAARMESNSLPGKISLTRRAWDKVSTQCEAESIVTKDIKGKGEMELIRFGSFV
jgi:class 3 adenylate cyclase